MKRLNGLHGPKSMDENFGQQLGSSLNPKYGSHMGFNQLDKLMRNMPCAMDELIKNDVMDELMKNMPRNMPYG